MEDRASDFKIGRALSTIKYINLKYQRDLSLNRSTQGSVITN